MGKIRVADLARKMGIPEQDLLFKLKSIGVRMDEKDAKIDSSMLQSILQGKSLPQPREVILRDAESKATVPTVVRRRAPARRLPPSPPRPGRRRMMVHKVEPRIRTIPVTEKPTPPGTSPATAGAVAGTPPEAAAVEGKTAAGAQAGGTTDQAAGVAKTGPATTTAEPTQTATTARVQAATSAATGAADAPASIGIRRSDRRAERRQRIEGDKATLLPFKGKAPKEAITIVEGMTVREFADKLGVKAKDLIRELVKRGVMATINHVLDVEFAEEFALDLGVDATTVSFEEEIQFRQESEIQGETTDAERVGRAPVVTIMGHVDHGKTTLLDVIRSSKITEGEFGGITQHIGAYQVAIDGRKIVFLDTPGHEAFTLMRARGAKATDIVVLVVAADDGVMPQTEEAIRHAQAAGAPIIVAINKMDRPDANADKVKKELSEKGLAPEDWGGDTVCVPISALKSEGIPELLEMILLNAEILELKASPDLPARGIVLEARKEVGRGIVATVLVRDGTLRKGDVFVAGATWGRVRSMLNDAGERFDSAEPATPVEVMGFSDVPEAGDLFQAVAEESKARSIAEFRRTEMRARELAPSVGKVSLNQLFERIQEGKIKDLPVILKADVQGSVEVLRDTLRKASTDQVRIEVIHAAVGGITTNDVLLASASGAIIVGFNVRPEKKASDLAVMEDVDIRLHTVIYELTDEIRQAMLGMLEPTFEEVMKGRAEVRESFSVPKLGVVAGCHVVEGLIPRNAGIRLLRDNIVVYEGNIASLRRFKEDASEVRSGFDCGIRLEKFQDVKPGDIIEAFVQEEVAPTL